MNPTRILGLSAALALLALPLAPARAGAIALFSIDSVTYQTSPELCRLRFATATQNYYRVEFSPDAFTNNFTQVRGMLLGTGSEVAWDDTNTAGFTNGFYRVREIERAAPLDLDGDGLDDVSELRYPTCLNALVAVPGEGAADCDGDGLSNQFEIGQGTDPTVPNLTLRQGLVINEIDYDQPGGTGSDTNEFVEVFNNSTNTISLAGVTLRFVNGSNNTEYRTAISLTGSLAPGAYLVVASPLLAVTNSATVLRFTGNLDNIQNGSPDAIVLFDNNAGVVLDALAYEGGMTAATITGFGVFNLVEGTALSTLVSENSAAPNKALIRKINGQDSNDSNRDWGLSTTITPGYANVLTP